MNKNQNSHFSKAPSVSMPRSRFKMNHSIKTTFNAGLLIPLDWMEILPGDSFKVKTSILARMQTLINPIMSDLYMDVMYFFVPNRLLWKHWTNFCGESDEPWFDETVYTVPQLEYDAAPGNTGRDHTPECATIADYMGIPIRKQGNNTTPYMVKVNHLPFRAYCRVWNEWWRNENVNELTAFNMEDADALLSIGDNAEPWNGGSVPLPVNKYRDAYTSALPQPQRGPSVTIGVGDIAPVFAGSTNNTIDVLKHGSTSLSPMQTVFTDESHTYSTSRYPLYTMDNSATSSSKVWATTAGSASGVGTVTPSNLYADISAATGISINELRLAFATQRFYEQAARSGSRYIEILSSMFHVTNGDARLQRSEFLGGNRVHINVSQVAQQSETGNTPLGDLGAYSLTVDSQDSFDHSFTEHGILLCVGCVRYDHSYSQGIDRKFIRKDKFDYYWPQFANIGEQPIYNRELFVKGSSKDDEVFGYQEAWYEYRYGINRCNGEFSPDYDLSLDSWHLGDDYNDTPVLSKGWIQEDAKPIERVTAVSERLANQFMADIYFDIEATRPMPVYSVPGLDVL